MNHNIFNSQYKKKIYICDKHIHKMEHNLNTINIVISIIIDGGLPTSAIIPGIDYVYTVLNENQIEIFATVSWSGNDVIVTVIG